MCVSYYVCAFKCTSERVLQKCMWDFFRLFTTDRNWVEYVVESRCRIVWSTVKCSIELQICACCWASVWLHTREQLLQISCENDHKFGGRGHKNHRFCVLSLLNGWKLPYSHWNEETQCENRCSLSVRPRGQAEVLLGDYSGKKFTGIWENRGRSHFCDPLFSGRTRVFKCATEVWKACTANPKGHLREIRKIEDLFLYTRERVMTANTRCAWSTQVVCVVWAWVRTRLHTWDVVY